jgi:hypothetical protein
MDGGDDSVEGGHGDFSARPPAKAVGEAQGTGAPLL